MAVRRAVTPCHHRLERFLLPLEVARLRPALFHLVDNCGAAGAPFPTVVTVHDLAFWRFPWTHEPASRRHYAGAAATLPKTDAVICVSTFIRDELLRTLPLDPQRVHVVHNGLAAGFRPQPDRRLLETRYGLSEPYVLALGTIEERKNLQLLLAAYRQLGLERVQLVLAGNDGFGAARVWRAVQNSGLGPRVRRLGRVEETDLVALYSSAELLAFPSLYEGFAFPPLEAMACGTPVVALRGGPVPEVCGDGAESAAELVAPTVDALAAGMHHVLDDNQRRAQLVERGIRRAAGFSWERCAAATWAIYQQVLHR
jgi:glycosyltransferase involved in cell wall biosynthesis